MTSSVEDQVVPAGRPRDAVPAGWERRRSDGDVVATPHPVAAPDRLAAEPERLFGRDSERERGIVENRGGAGERVTAV